MNREIELDILNSNYWEHFKASKDLSLVYPVTHPKRVKLLQTLNELQVKIETLRNEMV